MNRAMLQKAREATAARKWREAASCWLDASASSPIAAWAVGRALNAVNSPAALRFIRAAAYSGHPQAIEFMASRDGNAMQKGYWGRFSPHITINGQLPPDDPEALKQLLRQHKGANSSYIEGWAHQYGLLGQGVDTGIASAHEFYRTAALEGHPLAAIGYLRTWDPYYAQDSFESAVTLVANASNACPPALFVLGEQMLAGRAKCSPGEGLRRVQEAAEIGERAAQELLGTMEPRPPGHVAHLNSAALQGSVKAMRAMAKNAEPSRAIDLLIKAFGEEIPGTVATRALVRLARALKEEGNPTAALAVLNDEAQAAKQPSWAVVQEEARKEMAQFIDLLAQGLEIANPLAPPPASVAATHTAPPPLTTPSSSPSIKASGSASALTASSLGDSNGSVPTLKPLPTTFSVRDFLRAADISGADAEEFIAEVKKQKCEDEMTFIQLQDSDLKDLGLKTIGDRRRFQSIAKAWLERLQEKEKKAKDDNIGFDRMIINASDLALEGEPLGEGNFGAVYKGTFNEANVAVKILHDGDDGMVDEEEFRKEAKTLKELTDRGHPNVIRFFGICKLNLEVPKLKGWCIVTEFMANGSLKTFLQQHGNQLELRQLVNFGKSAAAGMLHLSSQNPPILHRDLAARNLLVGDYDTREATYALRVADFGLARAQSEYSVSGGSAVPIRWTAPEVLKSRRYSVYADVWSFGVTLWEIFTRGLRPYETWEEKSIVSRIANGDRLPRTVNDIEIPRDVYSIMLDCWHAEPAKRPDFKALHARLKELESVTRKSSQGAPPLPAFTAATGGSSGSLSPTTPSGGGGASPLTQSQPGLGRTSGPRQPSHSAPTLPVSTMPSAALPPAPPSPTRPATTPPQSNTGLRTSQPLPSPGENEFWCEDAKTFWRTYFSRAPAEGVPDTEFLECFKKHFNLEQWTRLPENVVTMRCFAELVVRQRRVTIERFGRVLAWFGPLMPVQDFLLRLTKLMQQPWFHGEIGSQEAAQLVSRPPAPAGSFLMRFSGTELGGFAFTLTGRDLRVAHYRLGHERQEYTFKLVTPPAREIRSPSLRDLVASIKRQLGCHWPCTGSPYTPLFDNAKAFSDAYGTEL